MVEVSVIVPVYNAQNYLRETLLALANQHQHSVEYVLIDDGSTDESPIIMDEWVKNDSRFRCVHIPNGGVYNARLTGVKEAKGEYVAFCDSDDIPLPNMMKKLLRCAKKTEADMVVCGFVREEMETGRILSREMNSFGNRVLSLPEDSWVLPAINTATWNKLIRTDVARRAIVFENPPRVLEDMMFQCSIYPYIKRIAFEPSELYRYRVRTDGAMSYVKNEEMQLLKKDMVLVKQSLKRKSVDERIIQACDSMAFVHFGLSVVLRQTQNGVPVSGAVHQARRYLSRWFPGYKKTGVSLWWNIKNRMVLIKPLLARWFFCAHLMMPFLLIYNFVTRRLKWEIKW